MRIDTYTKVVLTIIAACLMCIAFKPVIAPQPVVAAQCADVIVQNGGLNAIPVRIVGIKQTFEDGTTGKRYYDEPWNALPVKEKP